MLDITIGMATCSDYDGVFFTVTNLLVNNECKPSELLIIDTSPDTPAGRQTHQLCTDLGVRYSAVRGKPATTSKDLVFRLAETSVVLLVDCHVVLPVGVITKVREHFSNDPYTTDVLHGVVVSSDGQTQATHMRPAFRDNTFGTWQIDPQRRHLHDELFEIPLSGTGLLACTTTAWPGFPYCAKGFGGEEGILHERARLAGQRILCAPWLRWVHRFNWPPISSRGYESRDIDVAINNVLGFHEVYVDVSPILDYYVRRQVLPSSLASELVDMAARMPKRLPERTSPAFLGESITFLD